MKKLVPICILIFAATVGLSTKAFAAPTFSIQNDVHTCGGQSNGSFDIKVTAVTGGSQLRFEVFILGTPVITLIDQTIATPAFPYTLNVPNLAAGDYVV